MNKQIQSTEEELKTIELELEDLSIQMIDIFKRYKAEGVIDEEEYQQHVKVKENFLKYLKYKRKNS